MTSITYTNSLNEKFVTVIDENVYTLAFKVCKDDNLSGRPNIVMEGIVKNGTWVKIECQTLHRVSELIGKLVPDYRSFEQ